jgi:peptidyl-prolyl cis-trans isomerase A (cyclophilin A)
MIARAWLDRILAVLAAVVFALCTVHAQDAFTPPEDLAEGWYARIDTSLGRILARLHPESAPQAVAHFAALAEGRLAWHDPLTGEAKKTPYYDGIQVQFALAGQLFEAGLRPGSPGAPDLWVPLEGQGAEGFGRGGRLALSAKPPGISAAVFFVTAVPNIKLDGQYPCFGTVVSDLETVHRISSVKTRGNGRPLEPVEIERIRIFAVGSPPALPEPVPYVPERRALEDNIRKGP